MRKKLRTRVLVTLCTVPLLLSACGPVENSSSQPNSSNKVDLDLETKQRIKFNIYVALNREVVDLLDSLDSYYTVVQDADEFALVPDSPHQYKYNIKNSSADLLRDAMNVSELEPTFESLDPHMKALGEAMAPLIDTFNDMYQCSDFADNQYAKAKEFHRVIRENAAEFSAQARIFMTNISHMCVKHQTAIEQEMKDEGNLIVYNVSHAISLARRLLNECYIQDIFDDNITQLDLDSVRPLYEELVATVAAYDAAAADKDQLMKESLSYPPMYGQLENLCQAVDYMIRQVESNQPLPDPGSESLGSILHIKVVLNRCIDTYNSVFST